MCTLFNELKCWWLEFYEAYCFFGQYEAYCYFLFRKRLFNLIMYCILYSFGPENKNIKYKGNNKKF